MADVRPNFATLFKAAFGVTSPVFVPYSIDLDRLAYKEGSSFTPKTDLTTSASAIFPDVKLKMESEAAEATSWMGTPILYPITFKGGSYQKYNPLGMLEKVMMEDFMLPAASLVDFSRSKVMVKTPVLGSNGTIKELYGFEDWKIRIRGLCLNDETRKTAKTAEDQKKALLKWEEVAGNINVLGSLFIEKHILALTINSMSFKQLEGKPKVFAFEMECESDEPDFTVISVDGLQINTK